MQVFSNCRVRRENFHFIVCDRERAEGKHSEAELHFFRREKQAVVHGQVEGGGVGANQGCSTYSLVAQRAFYSLHPRVTPR